MNKFYGAHDQWTDLDKQNDVLITSTDGVIDSVKVNGEDYGGGGSSDFSTAEVTITSEEERWECSLNVPAIISDTLNIYNEIYENTTLNVVLYKGSCIGVIYSETMDVEVSGNATLDGEHITITGNCIITLSQK